MKTKGQYDDLLLAVKTARAYEKLAVAEAKRRAEERVLEETAEAHERLLETVREALMAGATARQIGIAYGSSDARTAKKLVSEAMTSDDGDTLNPHPNWKLSRKDDGTFNITVYSLGESGMSGHALCRVDDDGENFSVLEGDMWIQIQLYKLGYRDEIVKEATN
jgi:hypothetical protein